MHQTESERQAWGLEMFADGRIRKSPIYGCHWGDPDAGGLLRRVRDEFLLANLQSGMTALEIGSGGGRWSRYFVGRVARAILVDGTQASEAAIREHCDWPWFEFLVSPDGSLPSVPDDSIGFAFSFDTFVHFEPPLFDRYVSEIGRVLKPGGRLVLHYARRWPECVQKDECFKYREPEEVAAILESAGMSPAGREIEFRGGLGSMLVEAVRI